MYKLVQSGKPYDKGLHHGEEFRQQIHELAEIRRGLLSNYLINISENDLQKLCFDQIEVLKKTSYLYDEFKGISNGSGLDLISLTILNNYTDMRDFVNLGGCSVIGFKNESHFVCGQTWDMHASATPYILHIRDEDESADYLTVTGCLALCGINNSSVSMFINNLHSYETDLGLMWPCLVKKVLHEATSKEQALEILTNNMPCSSHNYMFCDQNGVINVETSGKRHQVTYKRDKAGLYFHTNHFLGDLKETEISDRVSLSSHQRHEALCDYFSRETIEEIDFKKLLTEVFAGGKAKAVCIKPKKEDPHSAMTCGGIVLDMKSRTGEIFKGNYQDNSPVEISF